MPDLFQLARLLPGTPPRAELTAEDAAHCVRVLRHQVGDVVAATDGQGLTVQGRIEATGKAQVILAVAAEMLDCNEPPAPTYLLVAPPKARDRLEWLVEKCVELGVTHLWLVETTRTERARVNEERLTALLWAALKQCQRSRLPQLRVLPLAEAIQACPAQHKQLAVVGATAGLEAVPGVEPAAFLIGPEGDFTPGEVAAARAAGWQPVHLGTTRLRTETAALYVLAARKAHS